MSKAVWKYVLQIVDEQQVEMPSWAEVLSVGNQGREDTRQLALWALVDPAQSMETRRFRIAGTGHPLLAQTQSKDFIGTVLTFDGDLVWHVFDGGVVR